MVALAYDLAPDFDAWLEAAVRVFRAHMDGGLGVYGGIWSLPSPEGAASAADPGRFRVHLDGAHPRTTELVAAGMRARFFEHFPSVDYYAANSKLVVDPRVYDSIFAPFRGELPEGECGIVGRDASMSFLSVVAPRGTATPPLPSEHLLAREILPHFVTGLRLRRLLGSARAELTCAEAIFSPEGSCRHAAGAAEEASAREVLRDAVRRLEAWRAGHVAGSREALIAGRWSLVERFESDGKRFIVAYRNPDGVLDPRRLSQRERDVAVRIAQGMSQKAIAAELGIRAATVAGVARVVLRKFGLRSTRELPLFWRDADGMAVPLGSSDLLAVTHGAAWGGVGLLTPAEHDVLELVVRGHDNRQIALLRGSSVRTVANQVAALLRKLEVDSRCGLAARALTAARGG